MTDQGWTYSSAATLAVCTVFACLVLSGCKGVPPVPDHVAQRDEAVAYNRYDAEDDEYSGLLFRSGKYRKSSKKRSLKRLAEPVPPAATPPANAAPGQAPLQAPAQAPALYPPNAYPSNAYPPPPAPPGYQAAVPPGTAYGQPGVNPSAPYYPAAGSGAPTYPPQITPNGTYPAPGYQGPSYPAPGYPPAGTPAPAYPPAYPPAGQPAPYAPPSQPYYPPAQNPSPQNPAPPVTPYAAPGPVPANGSNPVIPVSASEAIPAAESTADTAPLEERPKEEDDGFTLSALSPENISKSVKKATGRGPDEDFARKRLEEGRALFAAEKYAEAAEPLGEAAKRWPDSSLAEEALFLQAESLFFTDQYPKAQDTYGKLLSDYKNSRHLDTVTRRLFAIGQYWEDLHRREPHWPITPNFTDKSRPRFDTFGRALRAFETIRLEDPTGPLADDSIMAIATAYFHRNQYEDAAIFFDILRTEYPDSEHQSKAHVLCLESKMRSYQGSHYDVTPLNQAEEVAEQTLTQFRRELGPEAEYVKKTRDQIEHQKADREWAVAKFYDDKRQYGAARIYYRSIIENYSHTRYADEALKRLQELQGEPAEPPNRYAWLTRAFEPEDDVELKVQQERAPLRWAKDTIRNLVRDESNQAEIR